MAATADGRVVAVTSPPAGVLTVLDGRRLRVRHTIRGLRSPQDVELTAGGRYSSRIAVLGCPSSCQTRPGRTQLWVRPRSHGQARAVVGIADTADAWITYRNSSSVGAFTAATRFRLRRSVVASATDLAADPYSGRRLWVSGRRGELAIVATPGARVLRRIRLGRTLHHVAVGGPNLVGVVADSPPALVLLSRRSGRPLGEIRLGAAAHGVAFAVVH